MSDNENAYAVSVEDHGLSEDTPSFSDLYKYSNRTLSFTQEKRREMFLQKQKQKRCEAFDEKRDLSELFSETLESMEYEPIKTSKSSKKFPFGFKLMGSEWLTEVPEDLAENWVVKLCPNGVRYLVVAYKGITTCYLSNGRSYLRFKSNLPGGNSQNHDGHRFTVLDCIYDKNIHVFFVYDVLAWNSMALVNAEAHMRFCWLKSKFEENPEICITKHPKNFSFVLMDFFPAQNDILQDHIFTPFIVNECELPFEGVLFYHKEGHYISGNSPLVGWLKTFMLPEALHIDVHETHLQNKPADYECIQQYIRSKKKRRNRGKLDYNMMETEPIEGEGENIDCDNM